MFAFRLRVLFILDTEFRRRYKTVDRQRKAILRVVVHAETYLAHRSLGTTIKLKYRGFKHTAQCFTPSYKTYEEKLR